MPKFTFNIPDPVPERATKAAFRYAAWLATHPAMQGAMDEYVITVRSKLPGAFQVEDLGGTIFTEEFTLATEVGGWWSDEVGRINETIETWAQEPA